MLRIDRHLLLLHLFYPFFTKSMFVQIKTVAINPHLFLSSQLTRCTSFGYSQKRPTFFFNIARGGKRPYLSTPARLFLTVFFFLIRL